MTLLNRDQILSADDLPFEDVECPEWAGTVRVRTLAGFERDRFEAGIVSQKSGKPNLENLRAALCAAVIVDENGNQVFTKDDVTKLGMKSAKALDRIFDVGQRLSGLTEDDVKEMVEDFDDAQSGPSSSD